MPFKDKIIGVYKITNLINNKIYIGSSTSIKNRFVQHKRLLRINNHFNKHFQSAWNKYGEENFRFEILIECKMEKLNIYEDEQILLFKSNNRKYGYNKRIDCKTNFGLKASPETREKLRLSHLGHKRSKETQEKISKARFKPIYQLDKDLNIIASFKSIKEAGEMTGYCTKLLSACCTLSMKSYPREEYYWCFQNKYSTFNKPIYKYKWKRN